MTKISFNFLWKGCIFLLIFTSCNASQKNNETAQNENLTDSLNKQMITIIDDSVLVYADQKISQVVMILNTGDKCKIISKGNYEFQNSYDDFWYNIEHNGKTGWVFGSKTSLRKKSEFDIFIQGFNNAIKEPLSDKYSKNFLKGMAGFIPKEYKKLNDDRYAVLFYKQSELFEAQIVLMIYQSGIPIQSHILFNGNFKDCLAPQAFFTSKDFIKLIWPSCKTSVESILYFQILENNMVRELKSTITATDIEDILPKIKAEQKIVNKSLSEECKCIVHSNVKIGYSAKEFVFYSILRDECTNFCNSYNYSLIAMSDSTGWSIKFEEKGAFRSIYESGKPNIFIVVLEEIRQKHLYEKITNERVFLFDVSNQTMQELNLNSRSCVIMAADQYGCDYCIEHSTHREELIFIGNPVEQVLKKITNINYDQIDACKVIGQNSDQFVYKWNVEKSIFELQQSKIVF